MGLDMYFEKRTYVKNWEHDKEKTEVTVKGARGKDIKPERVSYIIEEMGYLRKANMIHGWIVNNCADGKDDCREVYLGTGKLKELLEIIDKVLAESKLVTGKVRNGYTFRGDKKVYNLEDGKLIKDPKTAKELLPTSSGFFFGSEDYDEWYLNDVQEAKKIIETMVEEGGDFYYNASW